MRPAGPILAMMAGQLLVWAALFYVFPALVLHWQDEFGWTSAEVMGAFTLATAIYALGLPLYGRLIDRGLAPTTFPLGVLAGAAILFALLWVPNLLVFYLLWAAMGVVYGLTLYEPCFALVTRARHAGARAAITGITLVGGFASTLAYPLTHWVSGFGGWRLSVAVLVMLLLLVAMPLVAWASRRLEAEAGAAPPDTAPPAPAPRLLADRRYWPLAAGFALAALTSGVYLSHLLPLMASLGVSDRLAVTTAALIGPSQVAGRVLMLTLGSRSSGVAVAQVGMVCLSLGSLAMAAAGVWPLVVLLAGVTYGAGYGLVGIMRAVATREVFGQRNYGAIAGAVSLPSLMATAFAPFLAALVADAGGYGLVIGLSLVAPLIGAGMLVVTRRQARG
ncbi:MFS transporter [Rhodobacterales bacterium HKCCE2091]|nr:MFS transporter [Rhodobacterales bacterium HKCCE2091]